MSDLFSSLPKTRAALQQAQQGQSASPAPSAEQNKGYDASAIEVLEGLEPVRKRPGMYIGGTDERALHHLVAEILDNAMDEAVAGHASRIGLIVHDDNSVTISDNGRGIPVDNHPKFPGKSALEVILTTLHSGGKFNTSVYKTSGGLHGVGISVVNALSDSLIVEVARDRQLYRQEYSRGIPQTKLENVGAAPNRRGTTVRFHPDSQIFGENPRFKPEYIYRMARSKAYLFRGVEIRWSCEMADRPEAVPAEDTFHFPNGLQDFLQTEIHGRELITPHVFSGLADLPDGMGKVEFAVAWPVDEEGFSHSYCNTIPTPQGGTHESGMRTALARSLKGFAEMAGNKQAGIITSDDVVNGACALLSLFISEPQFQGQTKDKLASPQAARLVDAVLKDRFDHWLSNDPVAANKLLDAVVTRAEERLSRRSAKDLTRKTATRRVRLPGKLADCSRTNAEGTELFIVEGDSAGGSAKQGRNRETQAILPLRGKILNVISASREKIRDNQEISDLTLALGCGTGKQFKLDELRYERVIIMTDADVDGAHIASLLISFFYSMMPGLVDSGALYLAMPPLYRLSAGGTSVYARDDLHKDQLMKTTFKGKSKVDISRFKGLGEMPAAQLKETTMNPATRTLMRVTVPDAVAVTQSLEGEVVAPVNPRAEVDQLIEDLMGRNAEARFNFIQDRASFVTELDI